MIDLLLPNHRAAHGGGPVTANGRTGPRFNLNERFCCTFAVDAVAVKNPTQRFVVAG